MKKTVVHVVEAWQGGIATYIEALAQKQIALSNRVILIVDQGLISKDQRKINGCEYLYYKSSRNPINFIKINKKLNSIISNLNADVVHVHSSYPGFYLRLRNSIENLVYSPHAWSFSKKDIGWIKRIIYSKSELLLSKNCQTILCISQEEIELATKVGINIKKLQLVHTCLPNLAINKVENIQNNPQIIKIGFFGRLDYQKGYDLLVSSAHMLQKNIEIHVFGDSVRGGVKYETPHNFTCHGWVNNNDVTKHMLDMDAVIIPSRWEGFALVPIESMRASKPIIVSNETSLSEVVIDSFNGVVIPSLTPQGIAKSLNKLNNETLKAMGLNAKSVFQTTFNDITYLNKIESVYYE